MLFNNVVILMGSLTVICLQSSKFMIVIIVLIFPFYLIQNMYRNTSRELKRLDAINSGELVNHIQESVSGVQIIRAFNQKDRFVKEFKCKLKNSCNSSFCIFGISAWLDLRLEILALSLTVSNLVYYIINRY
jgi:ATP-binding cassette subfamily C (CFTR/MRP) protein 1